MKKLLKKLYFSTYKLFLVYSKILKTDKMKLQKRLTLIIKDGVIVKHHYPVFPSNKDVDWVISSLKALA